MLAASPVATSPPWRQAYFVISVTAYMSNLDVASTVFAYRRNCVAEYMSLRNLQPSLRHRVLDYLDYLWVRQKGLGELPILHGLSHSLRADVLYHCSSHLLLANPAFGSARLRGNRHGILPASLGAQSQHATRLTRHILRACSGRWLPKGAGVSPDPAAFRRRRHDLLGRRDR